MRVLHDLEWQLDGHWNESLLNGGVADVSLVTP